MRQPVTMAFVFLMVGLLTVIFSYANFDARTELSLVEQKLYLRVHGKNLVGLKPLLYVSPQYSNRRVKSILVKARNTGKTTARARIRLNEKVRMVAEVPAAGHSPGVATDVWFRLHEQELAYNAISELDLLTHGEMIVESVALQFER